jgi:hypothetical protein
MLYLNFDLYRVAEA